MRLGAWALLVLAIGGLGYAQRFTGGKPDKNAVFEGSTAVGSFVLFALILGVDLAISIGTSRRDLFALRRPRSVRISLGLVVGVFLVVNAVGLALDPVLHAGEEQGLTPSGWQAGHAAAFAANMIAFGFFGPLVEELTFRGLGYGLLQRWGQWLAIGVTGVAFGVWHGLVEALPVLTLFGVLLAYVRARTGSLYPCIALHSVFNVVALVAAVLS